jgi:hypothetical protein
LGWSALLGVVISGCTAEAQLLGQPAQPKPMPEGIELAFNHRETSRYRSPISGQWRQGDDLEAFVLASIRAARREILVAVQELSLPQVAEALAVRHREGLKTPTAPPGARSTQPIWHPISAPAMNSSRPWAGAMRWRSCNGPACP